MAEQISLITQYERIKAEHGDAIVFFRLGDFYEMFNHDAVEASKILNLTLTKRQSVPMCGVPWHASKAYIARLLKAGKKVAICEQTGTPHKGKGIIARKVIEVISPGTVTDEDYLDSAVDTYLLALAVLAPENRASDAETVSLAWISTSTGEFRAESFMAADKDSLRRELCRIAPRELIVRESSLHHPIVGEALSEYADLVINRLPDWAFSREQGFRILCSHFRTISLQGFGFSDDDPSLAAAGALIEYVRDSCKHSLSHITALQHCDDGAYVIIDESTQRNLEIVRNLRDGGRNYSLLAAVDHTLTPMGTRTLRRRLLQPLRSIQAINQRLDLVELFYRDQHLLEKTRGQLKQCMDLERLASRLALDKAGPKDLLAVKNTLEAALSTAELFLAKAAQPDQRQDIQTWLNCFVDNPEFSALSKIVELVKAALLDDPAATSQDGPIIRSGWNQTLDNLRQLKDSAQAVLSAYLEEEKSSTGISGLRLKYNRILGYHLELSKQASRSIPEHFIKRQSVSNAERFSTERLAALESDIMSAADKIIELERQIFLDIRSKVKSQTALLSELAGRLADLDCHLSAATAATIHGLSKPVLLEDASLDILGGRHLVVEANLPSGDFIPNDISLDSSQQSFALLTGPNMAGKSTFLRQNALIVLLAQAGCFVPARSARIGVCDRIFCRVGAQDNLARGESTFLLEMHETASILNNASRRSLVIMDEVGRGTGTQDGLAIAWAVSEYMLNVLQCRTLFATHYHELTVMNHPKLLDISMAVEERSGAVVFLKRVVPGPAAGSYGIHVAGLAGVPQAVVSRAEVLRSLLAVRETHHDLSTAVADGLLTLGSAVSKNRQSEDKVSVNTRPKASPGLFSEEELVINSLCSLDINNLTPLEALQKLALFQKQLKSHN